MECNIKKWYVMIFIIYIVFIENIEEVILNIAW